jgi:hypothetical protein
MGSSSIAEIAAYHNDVVDSLKSYFFGWRPGDLAARIEETDLRSAFFILTTLEAAFRVDYLCRCQKRKKDVVSKAFCVIYKSQKKNARLDEDIFETWKEKSSAPGPRLISELRGAFKLRHWLAHGRYWEPTLGRKYDFNFVYSLADDVFSAFELLEFD